MNLLLAEWWDNTIKAITTAFGNFFSGVGVSISNNLVMSIITLIIFVALIIYRIVRNAKTIEITTDSAINTINSYLDKHPFITEENLVEFNRIMLNSTKPIKFQWQRYVLERKGKPSDYLSEENCVTKPLRTNSYQQGIKNFMLSSIGAFLFCSILFLGANYGVVAGSPGNLLLYLVVPLFGLILSIIYASICTALNNVYMVDLYYSFTNFIKKIDRAVINMPEDIDYEILFTPKEIKAGIPALQEYLQKRALDEQEQIRLAKEREVEHETYNFDELGVDGSLVMERALKESESYLGNRRRLLAEIEGIQTEKSSITKDFDEENKTYQRNLRDIREEIQSLKNKLETVSDEITRSSLRRQQKAEVEKEQSIEDQVEKANNDYNKRIEALNAEIDKKRTELDEAKKNVEVSLTEEFKTFTDKTYDKLEKVALQNVDEHVQKLETERNDVYALLEEKDKLYAEKVALYEEQVSNQNSLNEELENRENENKELQNEIASLKQTLDEREQELSNSQQDYDTHKLALDEKDAEISEKDSLISEQNEQLSEKDAKIAEQERIIEELRNNTNEVYRYFDAAGREFYYDENGEPYFMDGENKVYYGATYDDRDYEEGYAPEEAYLEEQPSEEQTEEQSAEPNEEQNAETQKVEEPTEETAKEEPMSEVVSDDEKAQPQKHKGMQNSLNEIAQRAVDNIEEKIENEAPKSNKKKNKKKKK